MRGHASFAKANGKIESQTQFTFHFDECIHCEVDVLFAVGSRDLHADAGFALRDDGVRKADDVHAFLQHGVGEFCSEGSIAEHDGNDGVLAGGDVEAGFGHALAETFGEAF